MKRIHVLFVCLGNICRSPMAEAIFRHKVEAAGLAEQFVIDSAGTGDWHIGNRPHRGTLAILKQHRISDSGLSARQVQVDDFTRFDYIVAMDRQNRQDLLEWGADSDRITLILDFLPESDKQDVPDPYLSGNFDEVYEMLERSCTLLLEEIRKKEKI